MISVENFVILAQTILEKFSLKTSEAVFTTVFRYNFRPEVHNDVISSMSVDYVGMDVRVEIC